MDLFYLLIGGIAGTWIIYNVFHIIFFYFISQKAIKHVSVIASLISVLTTTKFTVGLLNGIIIYTPFLIIWYIIDLFKSRKEKAPLQ